MFLYKKQHSQTLPNGRVKTQQLPAFKDLYLRCIKDCQEFGEKIQRKKVIMINYDNLRLWLTLNVLCNGVFCFTNQRLIFHEDKTHLCQIAWHSKTQNLCSSGFKSDIWSWSFLVFNLIPKQLNPPQFNNHKSNFSNIQPQWECFPSTSSLEKKPINFVFVWDVQSLQLLFST